MCRGIKHSPQADRMPNPKKGEDIYQFKNWKRKMQVPYFFTSDFETLPVVLPSQAIDLLKKTKKVHKHIPCSYSYTKIRYDGVSEEQKIFVGPNAAQQFITAITREALYIREEYKDAKPMLPLTPQEQSRYDNASYCWVCEKELNNDCVQDHCHITGKYRGPAH